MKKLFIFILSLITLFSLFGCSEVKEISEFKLSKKGVVLEELSEFNAWREDYDAFYEDFKESGELRDKGWYSIDYAYTSVFENTINDDITTYYKTVTGSYYYSPFEFEIKANLEFESYTEKESNDSEKGLSVTTSKITSKIIFVDGVVYNKTKTVEESDYGKGVLTTYTKSLPTDSNFKEAYRALKNFFLDTAYANVLPNEQTENSIEYHDIAYHNGNKIEYTSSLALGDPPAYTVQKIAEFEKNSHFLKKYKQFETKPATKTFTKFEIKPTLSGSANRPSNYYKYEG